MRVGTGYDVHRLAEGRELILCGVPIPFEKGLLGHSDADVAAHAIMDALLGAAALGDIGLLFPDTDPQYEGISSMELLRQVREQLEDSLYLIENIDCTIIAQRPKLRPHIEQMRRKLTEVLEIELDRVSVKATTEEGLGFTGAGEGIAAQAICCLRPLLELAPDDRVSGLQPCVRAGNLGDDRVENLPPCAQTGSAASGERPVSGGCGGCPHCPGSEEDLRRMT